MLCCDCGSVAVAELFRVRVGLAGACGVRTYVPYVFGGVYCRVLLLLLYPFCWCTSFVGALGMSGVRVAGINTVYLLLVVLVFCLHHASFFF